MDRNTRHSQRRTNVIIVVALAILLLVIYFHPASISERRNRTMYRFPEEGYVAATNSQQYEVTATLELDLSKNVENTYQPDAIFIGGSLRLEIYNIGDEPLRNFRWVAELDQELHRYVAGGFFYQLPPQGIYKSYAHLWQVYRTKYDLFSQGALLPEQDATGRHSTRGYIYKQGFGLQYSPAEIDLDTLLAYIEKPIRLKLMHEAGTDYLLVYPEVDTSGITR